MATSPAGAVAPDQKRKRRSRTVNRAIAFVLLADVLALLIVEIRHTDRPKMAKGGGGASAGVVVDQQIARLSSQVSSFSTPSTVPSTVPTTRR